MSYKFTFFILFLMVIDSSAQIGFNKKIITGNNDGLTITGFSVFAADIDGDGDMDILSASRDDDKIAWYENLNGLGDFGTQQVISTNILAPKTVYAVDLDGDNDMDVVAASSSSAGSSVSKLTWYENIDGLGSFGTEQTISASTTINYTYAKAADIDGDGDMDIVFASFAVESDDLGWFENTNGLGDFGPKQVVSTSFNIIRGIEAADMDGDGDIDLVGFSQTGLRVAWFKNLDGEGNFDLGNYVDPFGVANSSYGGHVVDIDDDGDMDIINSESSSSTLYKNINDELGTFTDHNLPYGSGGNSIFTADLDNDGDMDLISGNSKLFWFENIDGQGVFGDPQDIFREVGTDYGYQSVYAADIDNDGDMDVQSASFWQDEIAWYENLGILGNEINGIVQLDVNSNGCDTNDITLSNVMINANNNDINFSTFTLENGGYQLPVNEGDFEVSITSSLPNYYSSNPISQNSNFIELGNIDTIDFCVETNTVINDLDIVVYPSINEPRPGFDTTYQIVYSNNGTTQLSGSVSFEFDDSKLQYLNASETESSQTSNTLTFDFTDLNPFEARIISLEFNVFPPPTTNIDDILESVAIINPISGDNTEEDNVFSLQQIVIGSYDPNDIACLEGDQILIEDANKYLHYLIRFQNTGTASAINVRVENVLDDKLDWTTMQLESLSHDGRVEIVNGSEVSFIFNNINLPDSTNDEPNSHGYIAYKIKPKDNVVLGDIFYNTADIYFDFNPPIITNTATTEILEEQLSVSEYENNLFSVFPNPTNSILTVQSSLGINEISIFDINGRVLKSLDNLDVSRDFILDVGNFSSGLYFLRIKNKDSEQIVRFIKH